MPQRAVAELQRHLETLRRTRHGQYKAQIKHLFDCLNAAPIFKAMLVHIQATESTFDPDVWITEHIIQARRACHRWPDTDPMKMKVLLRAVERLAIGRDEPTSWGMQLSHGRNFDEGTDLLTQEVVAPFVDYLFSRIGTDSAVLHLLARFKRTVEWFEQQLLFEAYSSNPRQGEDVYDRRLRQFLFAEGIDYPYSKPRSASGEADIIAEVEGDDPLVCEVKLFDGDQYGPAYLAKGLRQVLRYAHDYGKSVGHLVVVNLSEKRVSLPSDGGSDQSPPRLLAEGITVFMVVVQGKPRPSASAEAKAQTVSIKREQMLTEVEAT